LAQRKQTLRRVGLITFCTSILFGIILILLRAEPDLEATMYGFAKYNYPSLKSLSCPVLMTSLDSEPVIVKLRNPLDQPLSWNVDAQFSSNSMITDTSEHINLKPGESRVLSWDVGQENVDLGYFIFTRVFASSSSSLPMRESTCGTLVLNLPFKGGPTIFYAILLLSVFGAVIGWILWLRYAEMSDSGTVSQTWWMRFITLVVAIGIVAAILNAWFLALLMIFLALLTTGVVLIPRKT
jgi:hypothetical protein